VPENWAYRLRSRNIEQVLDLHHNDRGVRDFEGVKMYRRLAALSGHPRAPRSHRPLRAAVGATVEEESARTRGRRA